MNNINKKNMLYIKKYILFVNTNTELKKKKKF